MYSGGVAMDIIKPYDEKSKLNFNIFTFFAALKTSPKVPQSKGFYYILTFIYI